MGVEEDVEQRFERDHRRIVRDPDRFGVAGLAAADRLVVGGRGFAADVPAFDIAHAS